MENWINLKVCFQIFLFRIHNNMQILRTKEVAFVYVLLCLSDWQIFPSLVGDRNMMMVYKKFIEFLSYCYTLIFHQRMKLTILLTQLEI